LPKIQREGGCLYHVKASRSGKRKDIVDLDLTEIRERLFWIETGKLQDYKGFEPIFPQGPDSIPARYEQKFSQ
jgi:hypothetical protein